MYFASFRFIVLSGKKAGREAVEKAFGSIKPHEDSEYRIEFADSTESLVKPLGDDCAVIIDGDVNALMQSGSLGAGRVVFMTSAESAAKTDSGALEMADCLWIMPDGSHCGESLLGFYFERLARTMRERADARRLDICLHTAIDSIPDLTWFKDNKGAHLIVNDGFCKAVEKTKEQIFKRGHYYIWDISREEYDQGEYVCLESEEVVIDARQTCLFDEKVKTKGGMRQFKTYKSPLIDTNGEIFGTCGIAHDVTDLNNIYTELKVMLESMPFAVLIEDRDGTIMSINSKFSEFFGAENEVIGQKYENWKKGALSGKIRRIHGSEEIGVNVSGEKLVLKFREDPIIDIFGEKIGSIGIFTDITVDRRYELQTLHRANTDFLTGLNNRRSLFDYLEGVERVRQLSMITIDLDRFKKVNDSYGHHVGDEALELTSRTMKECFPSDFIARLGGDEFLIVIAGDRTLGELEESTRRLLDSLVEKYSRREEFGVLTASAGIAKSEILDGDRHNVEDLMKQSDKALYKAKHSGKARYCVYS
jgi:diguanylate cyclase (GGDEF)-like protein/PAS domain S-box-containing protein